MAAEEAKLDKRVSMHTLRHNPECLIMPSGLSVTR